MGANFISKSTSAPSRSLRTTLTIIFLAMGMVPMVAVGMLSYNCSYNALHERAGNQMTSAAADLILSSSLTSMMRNLSLEDEWMSDVLARHAFLTSISEEYNMAANKAVFVLEGTGVVNVAGRLTDLMPEIADIAQQDADQIIGF